MPSKGKGLRSSQFISFDEVNIIDDQYMMRPVDYALIKEYRDLQIQKRNRFMSLFIPKDILENPPTIFQNILEKNNSNSDLDRETDHPK